MNILAGKKSQLSRQFRGCSCKKSQCIKNYCDCYQSMVVCTKYCKCIGCRNTEKRGVDLTKIDGPKNLPVKPVVEKQRIMLPLPLKSVPVAAPAVVQPKNTEKYILPTQHAQILQQLQKPVTHVLPQQQLIIEPHFSNNVAKPMTPQPTSQQQQQKYQHESVVVDDSKLSIITPIATKIIITTEICDSLLAALISQEEEGEQIGLNDQERAQLLLTEMERSLALIAKQ